MRRQTILSLIVLAALAAGGCGNDKPAGSAGAAGAPPSPMPPAESRPSPAAGAPDSAPAVAGARQTFLADHGLKGKCVLVVFGRPGAAEKGAILDRMTFLAREKIIPSLAYLRVEPLDAAAVKARHAARELPFEAVADPRGEFAKAFDAATGPAVLLVDKFGRMRYRGKWPDETRLEEWVGMLAAEKSAVGPDEPLLAAEPPDVPKLLAATSLPDLKDQPATLKSHMGKAGLMVMFVDTTCPFSNEAVGGAPSMAKALAGHGVNTVLVNLDDAREAVLEYHKAHDAGVPVLYDATVRAKHLWGVESVPTVAIIAADGTLGYRGKAVWADVTAAAEKALKLAAGSLQVKEQGTGYG